MITKLFEYVITSNTEENLFLDKIRVENPELVNKFKSLIKNKGLEIAKQKYKEFDPIEIKKNLHDVKISNKRTERKNKEKELREFWKNDINEIWDLMLNNSLKSTIKNNKYLNDFPYKYRNDFSKIEKNIFTFDSQMSRNYMISLERIDLYKEENSFETGDHISIRSFFSPMKEETFFDKDAIFEKSILYIVEFKFNLNGRNELIAIRNQHINRLGGPRRITVDKFNETLNEFSRLMSPEFLKQLQIEKDANKFGL